MPSMTVWPDSSSRERHPHGGHDHTDVKGNAYNFAATPAHAASFDLLGGQLGELACLRTAPGAPLGCVESAFNWFASLCELGDHLGASAALSNVLIETTAGWPIGHRLAERCAGQRHFLGFASDATASASPTNTEGGDGDGGGGGGGGAATRANATVGEDGSAAAGDAGAANVRNPYLLRQLMGICMFHSCKEVASLAHQDLAANGVAPRQTAAGWQTMFV